jgi:hypothetical protein
MPSEYSWDDGLFLLDYCLSDLSKDSYAELVGLPLVPLSTNSFGCFRAEGKGGTQYFLSSAVESTLLVKAAEVLVSCELFDASTSLERHLRSPHLQEATNVKLPTGETFAGLLSYVLPSSWKGRGFVSWDGAAPGHPSEAWLKQLWAFISSRETLGAFAEWPLVVTSGSILCRLDPSSHLMLPDGCSSEVVSLLTSVGCRCLDPAFAWQHASMWDFMHKSTVAGLLAALSEVCGDDLSRLQGALLGCSAEEREAFRRHVGARLVCPNREVVSEDLISLLHRLPIFETHSAKAESVARVFVDLIEERVVAPPGSDARLLTRRFLKLSCDEDGGLLRLLGVRELSDAEFYREHVFVELPRLGAEVRDRTMLSVLLNLGRLCGQDASFSNLLTGLAFVPAGGELKRPDDLYDPSVPELCALLDSERHFPGGDFASPPVIMALRVLGLRLSLDQQAILESARTVVRRAEKDIPAALSLSSDLLRYLDQHFDRLLGKASTGYSFVKSFFVSNADQERETQKWSDALASIAWLPVLTSPLVEHMPWKGANNSGNSECEEPSASASKVPKYPSPVPLCRY